MYLSASAVAVYLGRYIKCSTLPYLRGLHGSGDDGDIAVTAGNRGNWDHIHGNTAGTGSCLPTVIPR